MTVVNSQSTRMLQRYLQMLSLREKCKCPPIKISTKFLEQILEWDPQWLTDQKYENTPPERINSIELIRASSVYESYQDYCNVALPLLLNECWHIIRSEAEAKNGKDSSEPIALELLAITDDSIYYNGNSELSTTIQFEAIAIVPTMHNRTDLDQDSEFEDNNPCRGDFVMITSNDQKVFGYVLDHDRSYRDPNDDEDSITYTIVVKKGVIETNAHVNVKVVASLLTHMHLLNALEHLETSELLNPILSPDVDNYQMVESDGSHIATENDLNPKQIEIISRAVKTIEMEGSKISLIEGPPGTGKSKVIVNIVSTLINNGYRRILLCAPSNKAVDELVLRLLDIKNFFGKIVRVGRKERMDKKVMRMVSLATLVRKRKRVSTLSSSDITDNILSHADIIATTLSSSYNLKMKSAFCSDDATISICIVDEAGQAKELETLIPLLLGVKKLVLVGDPKQLPPTILSQEAKYYGMGQSLFARAQENFRNKPNNPIVMLDTQYRMIEPICQWPNRFFYRGALKSAAIVPTIELANYQLINHSSEQSKSFSNVGEAKFVVKLVVAILSKLVDSNNVTIGIITPYKEQQTLISSYLKEQINSLGNDKSPLENIFASTVDSYQGQERDVIIMSCVRSNGIGFVNDPNRLCVSLTRAKHSLFICGNFKTFGFDFMWNSLINDAKSRNAFLDVDCEIKIDAIKQMNIFKS